MWEAFVEGGGQLRRDFISYNICEIGCLPTRSQLTTQLIACLSSCQPFFLQLLILTYVMLISCLIQSSVVFGDDHQDSCAGAKGYTGSSDGAECGMDHFLYYALHFLLILSSLLLSFVFTLLCHNFSGLCLVCCWSKVVFFNVMYHGVLIDSEYLE